MTPEQEAERMKAIIAVNNTCARCGNVAWSRQLEATLELRPKRGDPDRPKRGDPDKKEVLCGPYCAKQDTKKAKRGKAA